MAGDREFELKFAVEPADIDLLTGHALVAPALPRREIKRLVTTYFDTPDHLLSRRRMSLRVRRSGEKVVQTLKRAGGSIVDRDEWERDGGGLSPDIEWLRRTPPGDLFGEAAALVPQFGVDLARTTLPLRHGEADIECAMDTGMISAGGRFLDVEEVEFELKGGREADLLDFARLMVRDLPLVLDLASKAARGHALAAGTWFVPAKTIEPDLSAANTLGAAFAAVTGECLDKLCRNAALIGHRRATAAAVEEAVHKTRIALRHLRAALALFRPMLRRRKYEAVWRELKWMSDRLGAARDADVFARHVADREGGTGCIVVHMRDVQRHARGALHAALASPRWRLLLVDILAMSLDGVRRSRREEAPADALRAQLAAHHAALASATRRWSHHSSEALHAIRKSAKMLRYKLELLQNLSGIGAGRDAWHALDHDLHILQEVLGEAHDATALQERLSQTILEQAPPAGLSADEWGRLQDDARRLADASAAPSLAKARKAARRLRRSQAF